MSFGTFSTNVQGVYSWGVLRQAKLSGMMMDIDRISATSVNNDNNSQNWVNFNASQGARVSANEHLILSDEWAIGLSLLGMVIGAFDFIGFIISIALALIVYMDLRMDLMALEDCGAKDAISGILNTLATLSIIISIETFLLATPIAGAAIAVILTWINIMAGLILINMVNPLSCQIQRRGKSA